MTLHAHHRPEGTDVDVVEFAALPYLMASSREDAFLVVMNPGGRPPRLPVEGVPILRLRFHAPEDAFHFPEVPLQPFGTRHADHVLRFLRKVRPERGRIVVCSPEGEARGPGLALGLADLMGLRRERILELELRYRRTYSRSIRRILWQTAHPPQPVATSPLMKAASAVLVYLSRHLSN